MKIRFILTLTGILLTSAFARAAEAELTLEQLQARFKTYNNVQSITAEFKHNKHMSALELDMKAKGSFKFIKSPKRDLVWRFEKPTHVELHVTETDIIETVGAGDRKSVQKFVLAEAPADKHIWRIIGPWIDVQPAQLMENYRVLQKSNGGIRFEPKVEDKKLKAVDVYVGEGGQIKTVRLIEHTGDVLSVHFETAQFQYGATP